MTAHIMIDIETVSTLPTAAVVSIGAVEFFPDRGVLGKELYVPVNLQSSVDAGLTVDADTLCWWMAQGEAARAVFNDESKAPLSDALTALGNFVPAGAKVWGHGAGFDPVVLENACRAIKAKVPWSYRVVRDTRTIFDLAKIKLGEHAIGTHHNALDDARHQAKAVCSAYRILGISH